MVPADVNRARLIWLVAQFRRIIKTADVMKKAYETLQQCNIRLRRAPWNVMGAEITRNLARSLLFDNLRD